MIKMIASLKQIKETIKKVGLRPTYQRIRILQMLNKYRYKHPSVEMIYNELKEELPVISMTTVYNTMNAMLNKKMLQALTITGIDIHYDPDTSPHHHFYCNNCHTIYDIHIKCPMEDEKKRNIDGHKIEAVHGYLKGICKKCAKRNAKESRKRLNISEKTLRKSG